MCLKTNQDTRVGWVWKRVWIWEELGGGGWIWSKFSIWDFQIINKNTSKRWKRKTNFIETTAIEKIIYHIHVYIYNFLSTGSFLWKRIIYKVIQNLVSMWAPFPCFLRHEPSVPWFTTATLNLTLQCGCHSISFSVLVASDTTSEAQIMCLYYLNYIIMPQF